jgi:hypothetical protein
MVLASQFNSFIDPVTVLMALPFSFSGALECSFVINRSPLIIRGAIAGKLAQIDRKFGVWKVAAGTSDGGDLINSVST